MLECWSAEICGGSVFGFFQAYLHFFDLIETWINSFRGIFDFFGSWDVTLGKITGVRPEIGHLFKFKEGENFNRKNTFGILRIKI